MGKRNLQVPPPSSLGSLQTGSEEDKLTGEEGSGQKRADVTFKGKEKIKEVSMGRAQLKSGEFIHSFIQSLTHRHNASQRTSAPNQRIEVQSNFSCRDGVSEEKDGFKDRAGLTSSMHKGLTQPDMETETQATVQSRASALQKQRRLRSWPPLVPVQMEDSQWDVCAVADTQGQSMLN
jgi:hypothetical protein